MKVNPALLGKATPTWHRDTINGDPVMTSRLQFLSGLLVLLACDGNELTPLPGAPPGFAYATATNDCAPWDGPATEILLMPTTPGPGDSAGPTPPFIRLSIWRSVESLPGTTFQLSDDDNAGVAVSCPVDAPCERASSAAVRFRTARPDSSLEGTLDASFPALGRISGGFRAVWRPRTALCG